MDGAIKDYGDTTFVTGMRGYAAYAVVMIHAGGAGLRALGEVGNSIADFGKAGVFAFFVISGFSVASSLASQPSFAAYFAKRMWRIAPLYYVWLLLGIITGPGHWAKHFGVSVDAYNIFMHLSFLSFLDYRIANSILDVEWTLAIEVFWYMLLPFLVHMVRTPARAVAAVAVAFLAYGAMAYGRRHLPLSEADAALAFQFSPLPYALSYALGVAVYRARPLVGKPSSMAVTAGIVLVVAYAAFTDEFNRAFVNEYLFTTAVTAGLILFGSSKEPVSRAVFGNRPALFFGTISYGVYLAHMVIIRLAGSPPENGLHQLWYFTVVAVLATVAAYGTYRFIERPALALSRRGASLL